MATINPRERGILNGLKGKRVALRRKTNGTENGLVRKGLIRVEREFGETYLTLTAYGREQIAPREEVEDA